MSRSLSPEVENIKEAYFEYLKSLNKGRPQTHFSASQAGRCLKIHQFKKNSAPRSDLNDKSLARLRIGDLIHTDIQDGAVHQGLPIIQELRMIDEKLNLMGHSDFIWLPDKCKFITVHDLKTVGYYSWSRKFGRNKSDDTNDNYELQLGTYAFMAQDRFGIKIEHISIVYIKVDDMSMWREVNVPLDYMDRAREYWESVNSAIERELTPGVDFGVPFQSWECNYCPYMDICDSPFKKG